MLILYSILVLPSIRSEETLITYLKRWGCTRTMMISFQQLKDVKLSFDLSVRLQSMLQRLSTSGGGLDGWR